MCYTMEPSGAMDAPIHVEYMEIVDTRKQKVIQSKRRPSHDANGFPHLIPRGVFVRRP